MLSVPWGHQATMKIGDWWLVHIIPICFGTWWALTQAPVDAPWYDAALSYGVQIFGVFMIGISTYNLGFEIALKRYTRLSKSGPD